jgi:uncharacterized protein YceK
MGSLAKRSGLLLVSLVLTAAGAGALLACMNDQSDAEPAQGTLRIVSAEDAAGRAETAYILQLPASVCLDTIDPADNVSESDRIHVFSSNPSVHSSIERYVGTNIKVRGRPFPAHTAHHHALIVMDITEISASEPR